MRRALVILGSLVACSGDDGKDVDADTGTAIGDDDDATTSGDDDDSSGDDDDDALTALDVLLVVDDSASMGPNQDAFADEVGGLVDGLSERGIDASYAVVTTTSSQLVEGMPVTEAADLSRLVRVGVDGDDLEQGLSMAVAAADGAWRRGVPLVVVGITDEEDCSHGGMLDGHPGDDCYLRPELLIPTADLLAGLEAAAPGVRVFGFNSGVDDPGCDSFLSERWATVAGATGGQVFPLCTDLAGSLQGLVDAL